MIALSAHVLAESFAKGASEAGCTTQLTKPIRKRALLEAVARAKRARGRCASLARSLPTKGPMREEILPLLPKFFANRRGDVRIIRDAVDRNDLAAVATLAHNMRGTGASYVNFPEISTLGDALQLAGKRQDRGRGHLAPRLRARDFSSSTASRGTLCGGGRRSRDRRPSRTRSPRRPVAQADASIGRTVEPNG